MSIEARLQAIEDRQELWDLVSRYCNAVDDRDIEAIIELFTANGSMGHADGATEGRGPEGIREYYESKLVHFEHCYHYAHNQLVEFDGEDRATGVVNSHAEMVIGGEAILAALRYYDVYARIDGRWRFERRRSRFYYTMPIAELATGLAQPNKKRWPAPPSPADLPDSIESYQQFRARTG